MEPLALAGIVALLLVKEAGVPIPVPGDLVVVGTGAALAADLPASGVALALILLAGYVGGALQFTLVRGAIREPLLRMLARFGVPEARVEALAAWLRRTGARGVAISRMTPGVRVGSIAASGVAALPLRSFVLGLVAGNTVFVTGHFALGMVLGASAGVVIGQVSGILVPIVIGVLALSLLGAIGWTLLRRRRSRAAGTEPSAGVAWADAACPACLALAVVAPSVGDGSGGALRGR